MNFSPGIFHAYDGIIGPGYTATRVLGSMTFALGTNWPTANKAFIYSFSIAQPFVVSKFWWMVGTAASGNVDAGVYDAHTKAKIKSTGSTAIGSTNTMTTVASSFILPPGDYLFALSADTTTNCRVAQGTVFNAGGAKLGGCFEQTSAFTLPDPIVPANQTAGFIFPWAGLYSALTPY